MLMCMLLKESIAYFLEKRSNSNLLLINYNVLLVDFVAKSESHNNDQMIGDILLASNNIKRHIKVSLKSRNNYFSLE